jgi:hypothetical protein
MLNTMVLKQDNCSNQRIKTLFELQEQKVKKLANANLEKFCKDLYYADKIEVSTNAETGLSVLHWNGPINADWATSRLATIEALREETGLKVSWPCATCKISFEQHATGEKTKRNNF